MHIKNVNASIRVVAYFILFYLSQKAISQTGTVSTGGQALGSGRINYTIGQVFYMSKSDVFSQTEGVHQPIELSVLPVEYLTLGLQVLDFSEIVISWSTATEINNNFFEIQRSADGENWSGIGIKKGSGTTSEVKSYRFSDVDPIPGISFYRIKQVDFDGAFDYSDILRAEVSISESLLIYPNPVNDRLTIQNPKKIPLKMQLIDQSGKVIYRQEVSEISYINFSELSNGIYSLLFYDHEELLNNIKILKNKE